MCTNLLLQIIVNILHQLFIFGVTLCSCFGLGSFTFCDKRTYYLTIFNIIEFFHSQLRTPSDAKQLFAIVFSGENSLSNRVAGLGRLSAGANMAMKPFIKRVITIFATNESFLRIISNFRF